MPIPDARKTRKFQDALYAPDESGAAPLKLRLERSEAIFIFVLFAAGFLLRLWGMSKIHFWDEMVYLQNAQVICCGKVNYSELDFRPPLLSLIFAGVFLLWRHIFAACIATAFINALGPVFLFLAGRLSVGRIPAAIASLLLAFSPFYVGIFPANFVSDDTGNSLLTDSPALALVLLAFWLLLRAGQKPAAFRYVFAGFALALCILMRFGSIPSVVMLLLLPLLETRNRWKAIIASSFGLALGIAPYLIWSKLRFGGFLFTLQAGWRNVEGPVEPFAFFIRNAATIFTPLAIVGLLLSLVSMRRASATSQRFVQGYLWFWLLLGFLSFSFMPHKEPRYILPLVPPVLLLAGSGLSLFSALPNRAVRVAGALCLGVALFVTFLPMRERFSTPFINSTTSEEELASNFLKSNFPANTTLDMSFNYPAFAFYTDFHIHELSSVGPALYSDMEQIPPGEILIVYREAEASSQSDIAWVDASGRFARLRDFPTLVIFRSVGAPKRPMLK